MSLFFITAGGVCLTSSTPPRLPATEGNECVAAAAVMNAVDVRSGSLGGSDKEPIPGEHPSAGPRTARAHSGPGRQCHRGMAPSIKASSAVGLERRDAAQTVI